MVSATGTCSLTCEIGAPYRAFLPTGTVAQLLFTSHPYFVQCSFERFHILDCILPKMDRYHVSEMFYNLVKY